MAKLECPGCIEEKSVKAFLEEYKLILDDKEMVLMTCKYHFYESRNSKLKEIDPYIVEGALKMLDKNNKEVNIEQFLLERLF